jgi:adenosylcobinamide-GDP ribazoletransferase
VVRRRTGDRAVKDALRLSFGTLTILPVRPPASLDRRTTAGAMVLAPLVGAVLGLAVAALVWVLPSHASPLLAAGLVVALLAVLTRGMHLDGLADTADGLGSRRPADQALALMRQGDVGPFGVVALVLTLLLQAAATTQLVTSRFGLGELVGALVLSRLVLPLLCFERVPAARADGMGSSVAGTVGPGAAVVAVALALVAAMALTALLTVPEPSTVGLVATTPPPALGSRPLHVVATVCLPLLLTGLFARHCVRRLGGITGDVLGACVEVTLTVALVVAAL